MTERDKNGGYGNKWTPILVAIVGAVIGSSGGIALVFNTPFGQSVARPDPFTGAQAASLTNRIGRFEAEIDNHIRRHPDVLNQFDRRIATLEAQFTIILQNQGRILDRLDDR